MVPSPQARRCLQWRLRTFFGAVLLCAVAVWLALQIGWMRERHAALAWMRSHSDEASYAAWVRSPDGAAYQLEWDPALGGASLTNVVGHGLETAAPWSLRLLGEPGISAVAMRGTAEQLSEWSQRFGRLFPEAQLLVVETPPPRPTLPPGQVVVAAESPAGRGPV